MVRTYLKNSRGENDWVKNAKIMKWRRKTKRQAKDNLEWGHSKRLSDPTTMQGRHYGNDMFIRHQRQKKQAGGFLRHDCAPTYECPQFADLWSESAERCRRSISGSAHLCHPLLLQRRPPALMQHTTIGGKLPEWQTSNNNNNNNNNEHICIAQNKNPQMR